MTARATPGSANETPMWRPEKIHSPIAKAISVAGSIIASVTSPYTTTLPHKTGSRRGTAVIDARIIPVEYSAVITSTPRTPSASCASWRPARFGSNGLKAARSCGLHWTQLVQAHGAANVGKAIGKANGGEKCHRVE